MTSKQIGKSVEKCAIAACEKFGCDDPARIITSAKLKPAFKARIAVWKRMVDCGWTHEQIGKAFNREERHVGRYLEKSLAQFSEDELAIIPTLPFVAGGKDFK